MSSGEEILGAAAEVLGDFETGKVVLRFLRPDSTEDDEAVMEVHLSPDVARDLAFTLTKASTVIEDHEG